MAVRIEGKASDVKAAYKTHIALLKRKFNTESNHLIKEIVDKEIAAAVLAEASITETK